MILLIAVVGGIAFLAQYLPNWRQRTVPDPGPIIRFAYGTQAVWEPEDEKNDGVKVGKYAKEIEQGSTGHYDFPFENTIAGTAVVGLENVSCDCSKIEGALLSDTQWSVFQSARWNEKAQKDLSGELTWKALKPDRATGLEVPRNGHGVIRISWVTRKSQGRLNLGVDLWMRPKERSGTLQSARLETLTAVVLPVRFDQTRINLGTLTGGSVARARFHAWSATRSTGALNGASRSPLLKFTITPLTADEAKKLEKDLRDNVTNTRVRLAWRIDLTLEESKNGRQLDQGVLPKDLLAFQLDEDPLLFGPFIEGKVQGEVEMTGVDQQGRLQLGSYPAHDGAKRRLVLWTDKGTGLKVEGREPPLLQVQLREDPKASTDRKTNWVMDVVVPPDSPTGSLPDGSGIVLRAQAATPRLIRIPVLGTSLQR
jgi:hypothetical protein